MGDKPKPYVLVPPWKPAPAAKPSRRPEQAPSISSSRKRTLSTVYVQVPVASYVESKRRRLSAPPSDLGGTQTVARVLETPTNSVICEVYTRLDEEIDETEDLEVYGETRDEEDEPDEDPEAPVRLLSHFTIFNRDTLELVPAAELERHDLANLSLAASGIVKPWVEDDIDEDEDEDVESLDLEGYNDWKRVFLTNILEFNVHHVDEAAAELDPYVPSPYTITLI
jgi:hypothetical protein